MFDPGNLPTCKSGTETRPTDEQSTRLVRDEYLKLLYHYLKANVGLGFKSRTSFEAGLRRTIEWYQTLAGTERRPMAELQPEVT